VTTHFNEADEYVARVCASLMGDFQNALDLESIGGYREIYRRIAAHGPRRARIALQKWLHDDMAFPDYWISFVTGASDALLWERPA
jgi:hypothetical protein